MRKLTMVAAAVAGASLLLGAVGGHAKVGDKPSFKFGDALDNGPGVTSLESLRGKPVVVEFWATY